MTQWFFVSCSASHCDLNLGSRSQNIIIPSLVIVALITRLGTHASLMDFAFLVTDYVKTLMNAVQPQHAPSVKWWKKFEIL